MPPAARRSGFPVSRGTPIFSPDNKWIAFTKAVPPATPRPAPARPPSSKLTDERFKGRIYDWMNARFDGRGYLPDPRDPHATPPQELFVVARDGGDAAPAHHAGRQRRRRRLAARQPGAGLRGQPVRARRVRLRSGRPLHRRARRARSRGSPTTASITRRRSGRPTASIVALREQSLNQILAAKQTFGSPTDLYRFPAGGGTPVNLTATWDFIPGTPRIAPEGRVLQFTAGRRRVDAPLSRPAHRRSRWNR